MLGGELPSVHEDVGKRRRSPFHLPMRWFHLRARMLVGLEEQDAALSRVELAGAACRLVSQMDTCWCFDIYNKPKSS